MVKKRTTLDAIFGDVGSPPLSVEPTAATESDKKRPAVKQQTVYLTLRIHEQLRRLAFEENVRMHELLMEGLDRVFRARGLMSVSELNEKE